MDGPHESAVQHPHGSELELIFLKARVAAPPPALDPPPRQAPFFLVPPSLPCLRPQVSVSLPVARRNTLKYSNNRQAKTGGDETVAEIQGSFGGQTVGLAQPFTPRQIPQKTHNESLHFLCRGKKGGDKHSDCLDLGKKIPETEEDSTFGT